MSETIPAALQPDIDAALAWFNREQPIPFEVTGIIDADAALGLGTPRELKLVLCGGDRCEQRSFRVVRNEGGAPEVALIEDPATALNSAPGASAPRQAELDPPPGARRGWLDRTLDQRKFTVVLFYRGFW